MSDCGKFWNRRRRWKAFLNAHLKQTCVLCKTCKVTVYLNACTHLCICEHCATDLNKCPICQTPVEMLILIVDSGENREKYLWFEK